jgi:hypothetical protein
MKKEIEIKVRNESPSYSSETVVLVGGNRYKIVAENGNAFSHLKIYRYTLNGDLGQIACCYDIPNYKRVDYIWSDTQRLLGNRKNIEAAEEYIKKVF